MAKQSAATATKRQINRLKKESADLWMALSDVEVKTNVIIEHILNHREQRSVDLTVEQIDTLSKARDRLKQFDEDMDLLVNATDE